MTTLSTLLHLPTYTVHSGSGASHKVLLSTTDRTEALNLASFESQLSDALITVEVTA